jgi:predicted DsbA family dithiol-disulfide isomerase
MNLQRLFNWLLNGATVVLVICAILTTALRLRDARATPNSPLPTVSDSGGNRIAPKTVANWRIYADAGNRMGPTNAAVTIVEFSDFQCPFCRRAAPTLRALRRRYPEDIAVVYRHFPGHQYSLAAAVAAECAGNAGYFEPYHDMLFAQAESIGKKPWSRFATEVGVRDTLRFSKCLRDQAVTHAVLRDTLAATALSVRGTPTFLINDLEVTGYREADLIRYVVVALGKAKTVK